MHSFSQLYFMKLAPVMTHTIGLSAAKPTVGSQGRRGHGASRLCPTLRSLYNAHQPGKEERAMEAIHEFIGLIKDNITIVTLVGTIMGAITGYFVSFINGRLLARKKDRLELINKQLNEFYGPLYV